MQAARLHAPGELLEIEEIPRPEIGSDEVLVQIAGAGLCHSDVHIIDGELPLPEMPRVLGHENAGYIEAVGDTVDSVAVGDPVVVYGPWGCGACNHCLRGFDQLCSVLEWGGIGYDGGFAEYLRVPSARYLVELNDLDPFKAAPLTDAALTSYRSIQKAIEMAPSLESIAIFGIGGLGRFGVQYADLLTNARIAAVDKDTSALKRAGELGADLTLEADRYDLTSTIKTEMDGGVDAVIDFVGIDETLQNGLNVLDDRGTMVIAGLGGGSIPFGLNMLRPPELTVTTVQWGSVPELADVIQIAEAGDITWNVERVEFDDLNDVFQRIRDGDIDGRAVLDPQL